MNFIKVSILATALSVWLPTVQAEEVASLPTIKVMADSELRQEAVGVVPYQEDKNVREALQHQMIKSEQDIQNTVIGDNFSVVEIQPPAPIPDMTQLSPALQQYVLAVATGLQSSDPTSGIFEMLKQFDIDRNNVDALRNGTIKLNVDPNLLKQLTDNKWLMK
ncbi:peptide signal protein [Acinetobacter sp. Root1280]|uniref:hypothetical protein n=1 Tax=Acinetobacter sp. Root1280 TaxID=1736444 RepID=UPI0006F1D1FF|nr:hypothetical protein [Acinetobacter sp. Root1280]KQW90387.1 peptide signal protein [Acinetobacter sp. Root1280]